MTWLMDILKIQIEQYLLIKYYAIKHLMLLNIYNIKVFQWSINYRFFDKNTSVNGIKNKNIPNKELAEGLHKPIIRTFNKTKFIHLLHITFGMQI